MDVPDLSALPRGGCPVAQWHSQSYYSRSYCTVAELVTDAAVAVVEVAVVMVDVVGAVIGLLVTVTVVLDAQYVLPVG